MRTHFTVENGKSCTHNQLENKHADTLTQNRSTLPICAWKEAIEEPPCDTHIQSALFPLGGRELTPCRSDIDIPDRMGVDVTMRATLADSRLINLLIRTQAGHYLDFRAVEAQYVHFGTLGIQQVPVSRGDVFRNRFISKLEKRQLMRFVKRCEEDVSDETKCDSFIEELERCEVSDTLQTFLKYGVVLSGDESCISTEDGMRNIRKFYRSIMRFGTRTPFLMARYGTGEVAQAFCRVAAVRGGVYALRRKVEKVEGVEGKVTVVTSLGERVCAKRVFVSGNVDGDERIWRVVAVIDGSIMKEGMRDRVFISMPKGVCGNEKEVRVWQVEAEGDMFILYVESVSGGKEEDVMHVLREFVRVGGATDVDLEGDKVEESVQAREKAGLIWGVSYGRVSSRSFSSLCSQAVGTAGEDRDDKERDEKDGVTFMHVGEEGHDFDSAIQEAERCFSVMKPLEEMFSEV